MAASILGIHIDDWITRICYRRNGKIYRKKVGCLGRMTREEAQRTAINYRVNSMTRRVRGEVAEILEATTVRRCDQ